MKNCSTGNGTKTVRESVSVTETVKRTYTQDWPTYNNAQVHEKDQFQVLLKELVSGVPEPTRDKTGRKPIPVSDALFAAAFKVYSTVSGRRFMSDLRDAHTKGFIGKAPHYNSIFNIFKKPELTETLQGLITQSALPLATVERTFAVDASGFSTSRFDRWVEHKWGKAKSKREWLKAHLMCGTQTNIVTAAQVTDGKKHDAPFLPPLLNTTAQYFPVEEVSADKGYLSRQNVHAIAEAGATPYIAFKSNSKPEGGISGPLPPALERRDGLLDDQAKVRRLPQKQRRHGDGERGSLQDPLPQHRCGDPRNARVTLPPKTSPV